MKIKTIEQARELGLDIWVYSNGDGRYKDNDGYCCLIRDGEELLPEIKKLGVHSYPNGEGEYIDANEELHTVKENDIN